MLQARFPDHVIHGEESGSNLPEGCPVWVADPLDGTTNFAHGFPVFAVSLALICDDRVELGVTYDPLRDEMFYGQRGRGAWCNDRRLRVSNTPELGKSLLATGFQYDRASNPDNNLAEFSYFMPRTRGVRRAGAAALDLAWVAAGRLDGYWEKGLNPWDLAAGQVMIQEAGGRVDDYHGRPWSPGVPHIVASNGIDNLHHALLAGIATARQGLPRLT
jgi:myo-inositol-1(or 4)-monophosphatase